MDYFERQFTELYNNKTVNMENLHENINLNEEIDLNLYITSKYFYEIIKSMNPNSAPAPDVIPLKIYKYNSLLRNLMVQIINGFLYIKELHGVYLKLHELIKIRK